MQRISKLKRILCGIMLGVLTLVSTACQRPALFPLNPNHSFSPRLFAFTQQRSLPSNFMWGVSTAGYQVEGGDQQSQWHYWEMAGKTEHRNDRAVDFLTRYPEDIGLARQMGANSFRISIEWSRVEPSPGVFDSQGIAYYRNVIREIKSKGMTPLVTLLHFTYPHWLDQDVDGDNQDVDGDKLTGWEDPDTIDAYIRYADRMVREFTPDVQFWLTFNEPNIWLPIAHLFGRTPPGTKSPIGFLRAARNVLKAHARAYDRIHGINPNAMVSTNVFQFLFTPFRSKELTTSAADVEAFADTDWVMDSMENGEFPYADAQLFSPEQLPQTHDVVGLFGKFDYVAFDYYYRFKGIKQLLNAHKPWIMSIYPEGLYPVLMKYHRKHKKPLLIAENGIGTYNNQPREDGWTRSATIVHHVNEVQRAVQDGANVLGYFHWAITDNYEWGNFNARFGLYRVEVLGDPRLTRIKTPAVDVYAAVIHNGGVNQTLLNHHPQPGTMQALRALR